MIAPIIRIKCIFYGNSGTKKSFGRKILRKKIIIFHIWIGSGGVPNKKSNLQFSDTPHDTYEYFFIVIIFYIELFINIF